MNFVLKTLLLLFAGLALQVLVTGCCSDAEQPFVEVTTFEYHYRVNGLRLPDSLNPRNTDTSLTISLQPRIVFTASAPTSAHWLNAAYARCVSPGEAGHKRLPTAISITSNQPFADNLAPGDTLHPIIRANLAGATTELTIGQLLAIYRSADNPYAFNQTVRFNIRQAPRNRNQEHVFTIRFTMTEGEPIEIKTRPIIW